jgi:hypothetical protein
MGHAPPRFIRSLPLLIALALPGAVPLAWAPGAAHAQDAAFADALFELLPPGEVTSGAAVTLRFLALDRTGAPLAGANPKVSTSDGGNLKATEVRPGVYEATWTPAAVAAPGLVQVNVKAKNGKQDLAKSWSVPVVPGGASAVAITANPPQIVLGQDTSATLSLTLSGGAAAAADKGELVLLSSSGEVSNITPLGGGRYSALLSAPNQQFPHLAVVTAVDRRNPGSTYGAVVVPLVGKANFPVTGQPGSRILVRVGDREYGPMQADAAGRAQVPIIVPPGVAQAMIISILGEQKREEPLDLQVPAAKRLRLFAPPASVPGSPTASVPVRVYVATAMGAPDTAAKVRFTASAGQVSEARHEGNGVYVATFTPPAAAAATEVSLSAAVEDASGKQQDAMAVPVAATLPATLTLAPEPAVLAPGVNAFRVLAKATGPDNAGLSGRQLAFLANGARIDGAPKDLGSGDYQVAFTATGAGAVELVAAPRVTPTGNPLARVLLLPTRDRVAPDGSAAMVVTVVTVDAFGYPVPGVPVTLAVTQGDGRLPATVTTDEAGLALVSYTAGRTPGIVHLSAVANGRTGAAGLLQANAAPTGFALPVSGPTEALPVIEAWRKRVATARVNRDGASAVAASAAPPSAPAAAGPVARLELLAEPAAVTAGGTAVLRVRALDANGGGATGQRIDFIASVGTVGATQDLGGGAYQATLTVPAGTTGEVKVSATTSAGAVAAFARIPVGTGSIAAWGVTGDPAATPAAPPPPPEKPAKEPRAPGEHPWLRVQAGYLGGLYSYQQAPATQTGQLYGRTVTVGGGVTNPAGTAGFQANARGFLPALTYLGFEASTRASAWSLELSEGFDEPISDFVTQTRLGVIGRYPIALSGGHQLHFGGRLGWQLGNFLTFSQSLDADGTVNIEYAPQFVNSTAVGVESGVEVADFFALGTYDMGFTDFQGVFSHDLGLQLGYAVLDNLTVGATAGWNLRRTPIYFIPSGSDTRETAGEFADGGPMFGLMVGYQR